MKNSQQTETTNPLDRKIRIYDPLHKVKGGKNYYRFMTGIGPCFGGTEKDAAVMKAGEFLDLSRNWPMGCLWEIEDVA